MGWERLEQQNVFEMKSPASQTRRHFLRNAGLAATFFAVPGAFAEELLRQTPWVTQGPLYPDKLPLDSDNDLIIVSNSVTPAVGEITHLSGRLLGPTGEPIKNAAIEIWQVDSKAVYLQERGHKPAGSFDEHFQGFGRFATGSSGEYYFRTIKPVPYPSRSAPHIHFLVRVKGREPWTTQLYIRDIPVTSAITSIAGSAMRQPRKRSRWSSFRLRIRASASWP
jgi:protocatechuate 3,4-dioxygenase, beta subunit